MRPDCFRILSAFFVLTLGMSGAHSASAADRDLRPEVLKVNVSKIESLGLYSTPADGNLGRDLWDKSRRSFLMDFLPNLPDPDIKSPEQQRLVMGLLLSTANAGLIEDDVEFVPGKDILTLRLQKLMDVGAYKQAFTLYSSLGEEPYHPDLARAGITAMLFNGERSLACLEFKTVQDRDFKDPVWADIESYCHYVMGDESGDKDARKSMKDSSLPVLRNIAANSDYRTSYSASAFDKMDIFERAVLSAEDKISWGAISHGSLKNVPNVYLGMLVVNTKLSKNDSFEVMSESAKRGIVGADMLGKFYTQVFDEDIRHIDNPQNLGWKQIPYSYAMAKIAKRENEKWDHLSRGFALMDTYGAAAFIPFGELMQTLGVAEGNMSVMPDAIKAIKASGSNFPGKWSRYYSQNNPQSNFEQKMRVLAKIMSANNAQDLSQDADIKEFLSSLPQSKQLEYSNIIENIDKGTNYIHNADGIYGNDFDLTFTERYVMPMPSVWDRLVNSSQDKRIGETVLLSAVMLHQQSLGDMYPGIARDVLQSLNTVGLTKSSRNLALELLLGQQ